jgi:nucleoside-diphosphate-sugar epimerase
MTDRMELQGAPVLVTGASGFIGAALCAQLQQAGAQVVAVSRHAPSQAEDGMRWVQADMADFASAREVYETSQPAVVFHLAGAVTGSRHIDQVLPTLHGNLVTAVNMMTVAAERKCKRIVIVGSLEDPDGDAPTPYPASPYAASKWGVFHYARMFHALYQLPVVTTRVLMAYGPAQPDHAKVVPYSILAMLKGEAPKLGSGTRGMDWVYVDDVARGLLAAGIAPGVEGQVFELGSGEVTTVRRVVEMLAEIIAPPAHAMPQFGAQADRQMDRVRVAQLSKSREALGWRAATPLREGLERTVAWYARWLAENEQKVSQQTQ